MKALAMAVLTLQATAAGSDGSLPPQVLQQIRDEAARAAPGLIEIRRQVHRFPELSGQEEKTAALVAERLRELGLEVETGVGGHGVVGVLRGSRPGPVAAYRADMDAVPSPIVGDPVYRSQVEGVKHVCGHDAHVAIGLGIAEVLTAIRDDLPGTVKFLFQPAEESAQGALAMIADGALENPVPEVVFALHTTPFRSGVIGCPAGVGLSGVQPFEIRLRGMAASDAVAAEVIQAVGGVSTVAPLMGPEGFVALMDDILREDSSYLEFLFVAVTAADESEDGVLIQGMVRASSDAGYASGMRQVDEAAMALAGEGLAIDVVFPEERMPNMHSDADLVRAAMNPIEAVLGAGRAVPVYASIPFFGEDFAYFQERVPGAMFFLGVANAEKGITAYNHMPDYDLDEAAIETGTAAMSGVLLSYLKSH